MLDLQNTQQWVFIVGDGSIFDAAVTQLVTHGTDLQVSHAIYSDPPTFLAVLRWKEWPRTILVNESGRLEADRILDLISAQIASLEPVIVGMRIIIIRLSANTIDVYTPPVFIAGKIFSKPLQINIQTGADLLNAVTNVHMDH